MKYEELNDNNYAPKNLNKKFFANSRTDWLFRFDIQMARCENIEQADKLASFVEDSEIFYLKKNTNVRQPIGATISSYFCSFDMLQSSDELVSILKYCDKCGFKGHNAKGLTFTVTVKLPEELDVQYKRNIDLFVNMHPNYFKSVARRVKNNKCKYSIDRDYYDFGNTSSTTSSVSFERKNIHFNFFRSTLNFHTILSTIELCKLVIKFCKNDISLDCILTDDVATVGMFNDYVSENSKYFKVYAEEKKIVLTTERQFFGNEDLTNGFVNCSDVSVDNSTLNDEIAENNNNNDDDNWCVFKYDPSTFLFVEHIAQPATITCSGISLIDRLEHSLYINSVMPF